MRKTNNLVADIEKRQQQLATLETLSHFITLNIAILGVVGCLVFPLMATLPTFMPPAIFEIVIPLSLVVFAMISGGAMTAETIEQNSKLDSVTGSSVRRKGALIDNETQDRLEKRLWSTKKWGIVIALGGVGFSVAAGVCLGIPPIVIGVIGGLFLLSAATSILSTYGQYILIKEIRDLEQQKTGMQAEATEEQSTLDLDSAPVVTLSTQQQVPDNPTVQQHKEEKPFFHVVKQTL